jgi:hypothetical protein
VKRIGKRLQRTVALCLVALSCCGVFAAAASANGAYFFNGNLGEWSVVSGVPRSSLYFTGAYTSTNGSKYCVGFTYNSGYTLLTACGEGTAVTSQYGAVAGRAVLEHQTFGGGVHYLAEERW